MPNWTGIDGPAEEIAILLRPRFSNLCLANAVEPLRAANELLGRDHYRWRFVTADGAGVRSSSGLPVASEGRLREHPGGALLMVIASYDARNGLPGLRAAAARFAAVAGLDTGAWAMAEAGLLDGRRATIHWDEWVAFSERFPEVETVAEGHVTDGDRITCGGGMTAFDWTLSRIAAAHGTALALEVSAFFLHRRPAALPPVAGGRGGIVERALAIMSAHVEAPLPVPEVARRAGVGARTLARAMAAELGAGPRRVYLRLRLAEARRLALEGSLPVSEIAVRCGYADPAAMTRAFLREYGRPPSALRAAAGREGKRAP